MSKKIGVVTWLGTGNYGTSLQSYALCEYLKNKGYDVRFLYRRSRTSKPLKNLILKILWILGLYHFVEKINNRKLSLRQRIILAFNQASYNTGTIITNKDFNNFIGDIDVFVAGSDQIWNTYFNFNPFFFLDFAGSKKRISYASSFGTDTIKEENREEVKRLLSAFSHIGVRELTAVNMLNKLLPLSDVRQVLDPTFLLTSKDWFQFGNKADINFTVPKKYIFCYLIGNRPEYEEQLQDVCNKYGIEDVIIISSLENPEFKIKNCIKYDDAGPYEFIKLLLNSTLVCTDSFHATAISINAQKNFVEFMRFDANDQKSQNSRIYDLLNHFNLEQRIYNKANDIWSKYIDFTNILYELDKDRERSASFLLNSIEQ